MPILEAKEEMISKTKREYADFEKIEGEEWVVMGTACTSHKNQNRARRYSDANEPANLS
jgi:hypothetical protein